MIPYLVLGTASYGLIFPELPVVTDAIVNLDDGYQVLFTGAD